MYRFRKNILFVWLKNIFIVSFILSACTTVRNYQKNKPFVFKNNIEIKGGNFSSEERNSLKQKMFTQLDDSMKTVVSDLLFIKHTLKKPPAYDSSYASISAGNMRNALLHLGYYQAKDSIKTDTAKGTFFNWSLPPKWEYQERVAVKYIIDAGNPTLVDTFSYRLQKPELQQLADSTQKKSFLAKSKPVSRDAVLNEITRLVELYRNNGYYKFTSEDLKMRGDTTIEALTNISDDPFENIQLLAEANEKRNKPTIKLALVLNPAADSLRIKKYYINNVYIYPDFSAEDTTGKMTVYNDSISGNYIVKYNKHIIKNEFLVKNMLLKKGDMYRQINYSKTLNNFSRTGVWQNVDIQIKELKDSSDKLDMIVQLVPAKKYGFEANIETSYSANTNSNNAGVGNLLGFSANFSLQNRNVAKSAVKMTHALRAGVELNLNTKPNSGNFINSNELSYTNTISIPKLLFPFHRTDERKLSSDQTFFSTGISNANRIGLFKLNSLAFAMGYEFNFSPNQSLTVKPFNIEYSNLYGRTPAFDQTLEDNPYLRYSFNTALVLGSAVGYSLTTINPRHLNRVNSFKVNLEESGALLYFVFPLDKINFLNKDLSKFLKLDIENTYTITHKKSSIAFRLFGGVGIPVGIKDTTLPFFKQYFGGGPNSLRGWPIRGIGPGAKALAPFNPDGGGTLSDRTGDIRLEANIEYRHDLFQIIPNSLTLKWAVFADVGNIWNYKNTQPGGGYDSTQFQFKNLYKQLGVSLGTGLRLDFNYVLMRFDLGFRFKRPDITENNGWKAPSISFNDMFGKIFTAGPNNEYKQWRYENMNFSIGLSYPF